MIQYWIQFEIEKDKKYPFGILIGCGLTAYNYNDAVKILKEKIFTDGIIPKIKEMNENLDISTLDSNHVLPNMDTPTNRGVWFPLGYK